MLIRRVLVLGSFLVLAAVACGAAGAGRPASGAQLEEMSAFVAPPSEHGFTVRGMVSTRGVRYGVVLLAPNTATAATRALDPLAAYLFRRPPGAHPRQWTFLAQTLLRGADVSPWELHHFCALTRRVAPDLLPRACRSE